MGQAREASVPGLAGSTPPTGMIAAVSILLLLLCRAATGAELEIEQDLARVRSELEDPAVVNRGTCAGYLREATAFLYRHGAQTYVPKDEAGKARLADSARPLVRDLFALRLTLADRLRAFHAEGPVDPGCVYGARRALRYARFVEEAVAEYAVKDREAHLPTVPLGGGEPSLMVNPDFGAADLRPGDILLVRSPAFVSAAIARIGDEDGQFSHLAMIQVDGDGRTWVMEALIEAGVVAAPLDAWLSHPRSRIVLFRHQDQELAARAAQGLHDWIREVRAGGAVTPYDYRMDDSDRNALYCAELVAYAFERVGAGLPTWSTSLGALQGHPFLEVLGVSSGEVFAPSDVEVEPHLRLVAEWRDLRKTRDLRVQDAVLSSILDWMARRGYRLTYRGLRQAGLDVYWRMLRPKGVLSDTLPADMHQGFLKALVALHSVAGLVHSRVAPTLPRGPLELDYKAVLAGVEAYRAEDCARALEHQRWRAANPVAIGQADAPPAPELHRLIGPPDGTDCPGPINEGG